MSVEAATHGDRIQDVSSAEIAAAAQLACLLEVSAPKPGNVSPGRDFHDTRFEDFLASGAAIALPLAHAGRTPLGDTVLQAITETRRWTSRNTNLGIVLLLAPLARAAAVAPSGWRAADDASAILQNTLADVLRATTVQDARAVYAAIRMARPGGMGRVPAQDLEAEPTITLTETMILAASRDAIAREYATRFSTTFTVGVPALRAARGEGLSWNDAVVETFLVLLSAATDTHITRRTSSDVAAHVSSIARAVLDAGGVRTDAGRLAIADMDRELRNDGNLANPGSTADLTAAALFVWLLHGGWHSGRGRA